MSTLLLLRHAKSSWDHPALADRDRPLAPRGEKAARRIAKYLQAEGIRPQLVLCSPARRTRDTLELVRPAIGRDVEVEIEDELYGADALELLDRIRRFDERIESVMLIGHNPGMQDLAIELAGGGERDALEQLHTKFPTAALATFDLGGTRWAELGARQASLTSLVLPRQLR